MPHLSCLVVASLSSLPCLTTSLCYLHFPHCLASLSCYATLLPHLIASSSHLVASSPCCASRCFTLPCYFTLLCYLLASHCLATIAPHVPPNPPHLLVHYLVALHLATSLASLSCTLCWLDFLPLSSFARRSLE